MEKELLKKRLESAFSPLVSKVYFTNYDHNFELKVVVDEKRSIKYEETRELDLIASDDLDSLIESIKSQINYPL